MTGQATGAGETPLPREQALLSLLEKWRSALARNAALRNPILRSWELDSFVHGVINRVLFLRICEDRGFLPPGTLADLAPAAGIPERISALFDDVDSTSPLAFYTCIQGESRVPHAREPVLDDRVLRDFLDAFSSPGIPCDFSVFPCVRLAGVFQAFFRKEIRLMGGHRAVLEETAAAKGAGGFPPPPEAAREYLVAHALERRGEGVPEDDPAVFRALDPACGPGRLLLLSFDHLVNRYRIGLSGKEAGEDPGIPRVPDLEGRFRIMGSLFGADPDPRAVEVTRMLILSMALEGTEGAGDIQSGPNLQPLCRVLGSNIRCGNAVLGPEYLEESFPRPSPRRIRQQGIPLDRAVAFPDTVASGGFDAVVMEPPTHHPGTAQDLRRYLQQHYRAYHDDADMAIYLIERGISFAREDGVVACLTPDRWLRARYGGPLRRMLPTLQMDEVVLLEGPPGAGGAVAGAGHCILRLIHRAAGRGIRVIRLDPAALTAMAASRLPGGRIVDTATLGDGGWTFTDRDFREMIDRLKKASTPLGRYVVGTLTSGDPHLRVDHILVDRATRDRMIHQHGKNPGEFRPVAAAEQVRRYARGEPVQFLAGKPVTPATGAILCTERGGAPVCTLDTSGTLAGERVIVIPRHDLYLLGILNSTLSRFLFREQGGGLSVRSLERFPVYVPDFSDPADTARHDRMVALVSRMLELHRRLPVTVREGDRAPIGRQIGATDREIDGLVYELYGLSEEERRIVEEAAG